MSFYFFFTDYLSSRLPVLGVEILTIVFVLCYLVPGTVLVVPVPGLSLAVVAAVRGTSDYGTGTYTKYLVR